MCWLCGLVWVRSSLGVASYAVIPYLASASLSAAIAGSALAVVLGKFRPASTIAVGGSPKSGGPGGSSSSRGKQPAPIMRLDDEEVQVSSRSCCTYYELHGRVVGFKGFVILPKSKFGNGLNVGSGSLT